MTKQEQAKKAIETLCKTASAFVASRDNPEDSDARQLKITAVAIAKEFALDDKIMKEYDEMIEKTIETSWTDGIPYKDAEDARDIIYEMCDRLNDPREIMLHVKNASEVLYTWDILPEIAQ